jgi:hypothetical protein
MLSTIGAFCGALRNRLLGMRGPGLVCAEAFAEKARSEAEMRCHFETRIVCRIFTL